MSSVDIGVVTFTGSCTCRERSVNVLGKDVIVVVIGVVGVIPADSAVGVIVDVAVTADSASTIAIACFHYDNKRPAIASISLAASLRGERVNNGI